MPLDFDGANNDRSSASGDFKAQTAITSLAGIIRAKKVLSNRALTVSEYFGTSSSGDTRLSACVARATGEAREANHTPEFDEYIMVVSGQLTIQRAGIKGVLCCDEGVMLKAGEKVLWIFNEPCVYTIICLPPQSSDGELEGGCARTVAASQPAAPPASSRSSTARSRGSKCARSTSDPALPMECLYRDPELTELPLKEEPWKASTASQRPPSSAATEDHTSPPPSESLSGTDGPGTGAATPTNYNIPDYIPASGDMTRATSLSIFDQILDTTGLLALRELRDKHEELADERPARYGAKHLNTPIVVVSSELNPWSKTGGLAMVAGSYGYEFAVRGHRTMAISPRYSDYANCHRIGSAKIWLNGQHHEVQYYHQRQDYGNGKGCDYIFVEHPCYHRAAGLYGDPAQGGEYEDNLFRFALLTLAATEAPLILNLGGSIYGQEVLFIANDWQTALLPVYLLHKYKRNNTYRQARSMLVLHNLGYQGKYRKSKFPCDRFLGLPHEAEGCLQGEDMHYGEDCMNLLGAGIQVADRVLTVSPNYANEIQSPEGGHGLHDVIKQKSACLRVAGILNGISDEWNPVNDPHIQKNFDAASFEQGKAICKAAVQREMGLMEDPSVPLVGFCGRLCYQKGIHLITETLPWLMTDQGNGVNGRVQLLMMGKGDKTYEEQLRAAEGNYRGRVCGYVGFDPAIEHRMLAACDFLLMPSQYEPCGLPQMYAQAYATLPVVHETGGLKDSVRGLWDEIRDKDTATGFLFSGFEKNKLMEKLYQALHVYHYKQSVFRQMQKNAIQSNFYWPQAIDEYEKHIDYTMEDPPFCQ